MKNRSLILGLVSALTLPFGNLATAQDRYSADPRGLYAGGAIGRGGYDASFTRTLSVIQGTGATAGIVTANVIDTMWKGYLGYRVSPNFSVEGGYWNFGRLDISAGITAPAVAVLQRDYRANGYGTDAVLWFPGNSGVSALLKAGAIRTTTKASASNPGAGLTALPAESSSSISAHLGAGVEYRLSHASALRFEYENVHRIGDDAKFGTANVNIWSIGANYRF